MIATNRNMPTFSLLGLTGTWSGQCINPMMIVSSFVGKKISIPEPGDIVILWREDPKSWKGHVTIFLQKYGTDSQMCFGGNQGGKAQIRVYPDHRVLGFRRLLAKK